MTNMMTEWFKNRKRNAVPKNLAHLQRPKTAAALMIALEPRIMFDGAAVATAEAVVDHADAHAVVPPAQPIEHSQEAAPVTQPSSHEPQPSPAQLPTAAQANESLVSASGDKDTHPAIDTATGNPPTVTEVLVVDTRIPEYQTIVDAAEPNVKVILLDPNKDGVRQIADGLKGLSNIESISIVSHGDEGVLLLGNGPLFNGNLDKYSSELASIGHVLRADGDILLYGCHVGAGNDGQTFLTNLATATGADIAASTDDTGSAAKGGNWDLEITTGSIAYPAALDSEKLSDYDHLLVTSSVSTVAQLKAAISTGNSDGVDDVITITGNITFASTSDAITISVTDGHTMSIVGGGNTLDAAYYARALNVTAGTVAISNLTITHGAVFGNGGTKGVAVAGGFSNGGALSNAGTLTLTDVTITQNIATGGGGGGGDAGATVGGGGGGGSGAGGVGGGNGGNAGVGGGTYNGTTGSAGSGGRGGGYKSSIGYMGGRGGTSSGGGAGGVGLYGYSNGGAGATASAGGVTIGGGGGGSGWDANGGSGGGAAGAIYNTGTITILGTSAITNNIAAAGGGGGGGGSGNHAGVGGLGVGAIWNAGGTVQITSSNYTAMTGNSASSGSIGGVVNSGSNTGFSSPTAVAKIYNSGGTVDTSYAPPVTISSVSSSTANGTFKVGDTVSIQVNFSQAVTVTGTPQLTLETGTTDRVVNYASGSGTSALTFTYTVQAGDTSADLDYQSSSALALNGGTIKNGSTNATLTLASPGATNSLGANKNLVIDGVVPTVSSVNSSTTNGTYKVGDTVSVQVNFSEAVTVTGTPQLTLETGTTDQVLNYASGSGTSALTFTYTVQAGDTSADLDYQSTTALALNGGTIKDAAGNNATLTLATPGAANSLGANKNIVIDGVAPSVSSVSSSTANGTYKVGDTVSIQVNFSEAVTVTGTPQLTLETGSTDQVLNYASGSGTSTLTFTYTIQAGDTNADLDYQSTSALALNGGTIKDAAGNNATLTLATPGAANSLGSNKNIVVDGVVPTVSSVNSSTANGTYKIGDTVSVQVNFSEAVTVTGTPQLTLETGTTDRVLNYASGSGTSALTFTYTVQAGDTTSDLDYVSTSALALNGGAIKDAAGNNATLTLATPGAANSLGSNKAIVIDGVRPTASVVVSDTALKAGETSLVSFTFSEAVTGFTNADLTVANGTLTSVSSSDGGITWTATLTPTTSLEDATNIITLDNTGVADAAGNAGTGTTDSNNYAIDTVRPGASIVVSDNALKVGETSLVTITFNEAVTGFTNADLTIANGALTAVSSSDGGVTWTATFTPTASLEDATNIITLDNTGVADAAGNAGTGTTDSNNYAIDTLRPSASIVVSDTALKAGETSLVTFTFSEAVTGFTAADLTVASGAVTSVSSSDGGITWTATLTPTASVEDATNLITLDNTGVADGAGNAGTGTTDSNNYAVDTLRPTATINLADSTLTAGETSLVTFTFSEAVTGFTNADLTIASGTLGAVSSSDGGITWTATFTPSLSTQDATNVVTLDNTGVSDASGNTGAGTTDSGNYIVDNVNPVNTVPGTQTTDTQTAITFSTGNGNAISVADGTDLTTVVSVASGTLTATTGGGAVITNNTSGSVTLAGTASQINAALQGLVYTPDASGNQSITLLTTDAASNTDSDTINVTVNHSTLLVTSNLDTGADATTGASLTADQADGGGLSVREALAWAHAGDTVTFDLDNVTSGHQGGSITLGGTQLDITKALTINGDLDGNGTADVSISGNNASRVLGVNGSLNGVAITGLTLTHGTTFGGGGGLFIASGSNVTVRDSVITNNADSGNGGGGVMGSAVTLTMINSTVSNNTSNTFGGGIRLVGFGGELNLINSTVSGNTTTGTGAHGGGIQFGGSNPLRIVNSTISGNSALGSSSFGGGLRITSGTVYIYDSTIVGNASSSTGGGVNASGTETFVNTVVAGNTSGAGATAATGGSPLATGGSADDVGSTLETATNSFFGSNVSITTNTGSLNNQGTSNLLLGNLASNNGSANFTHKPQVGSALINAGSNAALPADTFDLDGDSNTSEALPLDANGNTRVSNTVDIGAVEGNASPIFSSLDGGSTYTEDGSAVVIDSNVTISDAEMALLNSGNGDYNGASLVIVRNGGAVATDVFGFNAGSGITLSGGNLFKGGQIIASFDTSTSGQVSISLTDANGQIPTGADVNAILQQITYSSASNNPGTSATFNWTFADDSLGASSGTAAVTINPVNDAPILSATGGTPSFTENGSAVDLFSGVSVGTIEAGQTITQLTLTVSNLANGSSEILRADGIDIALTNGASGTTATNNLTYSVSLSGGTATLTLSKISGVSGSTAASIVDGMSYRNTSDNPGTTARVVTLTSITDNGGTSNGGVDTTALSTSATVSILAINDVPSVSGLPASRSFTEDTPDYLDLSSATFSDPDSGTITLTLTASSGSFAYAADGNVPPVSLSGILSSTMTITGSASSINLYLSTPSNIIYTPAADMNGTPGATLTISANDGSGSTSLGTVNFNIAGVNDAPVNTVPSTQSFQQDHNLVFNSANGNLISINDVDAGSGTERVTLTANHGLISLSGTSGLVFSVGSGTGDGTMTFEGTVANINTALNGLVFAPTNGYNGSGSLQISTNDLGLSGTGGNQTDTDTINLTILPLNPIVTDVSSSSADGTYKLGDTISITVTFDQAVTVDTSGGTPSLLLETGTTDHSATYVSGSGSNTLTFNYTLQAGDLSSDLDYQSTGALSLNGGTITNVTNDAAILTLPILAGANSIAGQKALVVDGVRPTASILIADTALAVGETSQVTITFSEAVTGFTNADLTIANGTLSAVSSSDGGITWTATFTPTANLSDTANLISLNNPGVQDAAGNTGAGITDSNNYSIDTLRPTATILVADSTLGIGETSLVSITFNEAVTGFTNADLTVANGTLTAVSSSDGGITWTATFTPTANITDTTNLITLANTGVQDAAGNTGAGTTNSNNYAIDTTRPTATIVVADTALKAGETSLVTLTFSEAVANFDNNDLTVANGTLSNMTTSDGGITWTGTLTPIANVTDSTNVITFDSTGVIDGAGNIGAGPIDSNNYAIDTARPTATILVADSALSVGEASPVTITFSEAVTGFTNADLTIANGTLSAVSSSDGGITWTATFTPAANVTDTTNLITLDNTGVQDAAGNTGTGTTDSNNYSIDSTRPTVTILVADSALAAGETSLVTVTFSEAVSGFTNADLTIANGTLTAVSSSNGGITWTATFTPTADITDTTNLITLANTGVQDSAGNTGSGTTDSNNYAIDTSLPVVNSVAVPANATYTTGQNLDFVVNLFEAVIVDTTNGTPRIAIAADTGGTLYANYLSGSGTNTLLFRAAVTSGLVDSTGIGLATSIDLNGGRVNDAAGNAALTALNALASTAGVLLDSQAPTVANLKLVDSPSAYARNISYQLVFSEPVKNLDVSDLALSFSGNASATIKSLAQNSPTTWVVTLENIAGEGDIRLDVKANTDITDITGNSLASGAQGDVFSAQQLHPVIIPIQAPLVSNTSPVDLVAPTQAVSPLIVVTPDASQIAGPTNISPLTTVEAPALITLVQTPTVGASASVTSFSVSNTPTSLDTSSPGSDPIGVTTATSSGTVAPAGGVTHLGSGSNYAPGGPANSPTIERFTGNADGNGLDSAPSGKFEVQSGAPLYIPLPIAAPSLDGNQQLTVELRTPGGKPLVSWLHFDPVTGSLIGEAPKGFVGKVQIEILVQDNKGNRTSTQIELQFSDHDNHGDSHKAGKTTHKPSAQIMGKPGLNDQFARYGKPGQVREVNALLSALEQLATGTHRS